MVVAAAEVVVTRDTGESAAELAGQVVDLLESWS